MKIQGITVYQVDLPVKDKTYNWSDGKSMQTFDSTVVRVDTDAGHSGYGEVCPLGPNYLPSYANGVRAGIRELGPSLIGQDPLELGKLNSYMDYHLKGHPYVKSGIDVACWDIVGKFTKLPVCTLLGGRYGESVDLYKAISQESPDEMARSVLKYREGGCRKFQLKLGGNADDDIQRIRAVRAVLQPTDVLIGDANTGWTSNQAIRVANAVADLDVYIEQPCLTYEECLTVRAHTNKPFVLDESIDNIHSLIKAHADRAADVVNIKISKLGGLTKTKQARDICVSLGLPMILEDTWGSDIVTSAIAHLAHSTPEKYRLACTDFNSYNTVSIANGRPEIRDGNMVASDRPGLGLKPNESVLGQPVFSI